MKNCRMIAWQSTRQPDADCTEMSLHGHPGRPGRLADIERRRGQATGYADLAYRSGRECTSDKSDGPTTLVEYGREEEREGSGDGHTDAHRKECHDDYDPAVKDRRGPGQPRLTSETRPGRCQLHVGNLVVRLFVTISLSEDVTPDV
jgi:hypothetical protein